MANAARGEVDLVVDGVPRVLRLTLGGMAELESRLGVGGLADATDLVVEQASETLLADFDVEANSGIDAGCITRKADAIGERLAQTGA